MTLPPNLQPAAAVRIAAIVLAAASAVPAQPHFPAFDAPLVVLDAGSPPITALGDFDGDGDVDAFCSWTGGTILTAWRYYRLMENDGTGVLTPLPNVLSFSHPGQPGSQPPAPRPRVADIDGDGIVDIAAAFASSVEYFRSSPAIGLMHSTVAMASAPIVDIELGDFNGDSLVDLAVLTTAGLEMRFHGGGVDPYPSGPSLTLPAPGSPGDRLLKLDVNRDGRDDILVVSGSAVGWACFEQSGITTGLIPHDVNPVMPATGDIDLDGQIDIVLFGMTEYRILRNAGPGQFILEPFVTGGPATDLADINGDGYPDGICCSSGGGGAPIIGPNALNSKFEISINHGGVFAPAFEIPGLGAHHIAGAADLNGDGLMDLAAGRCVIYQRDGFPVAGPAAGWPQTLPPGWNPASVADVDGDGDPDVVTNGASLYLNRGDGVLAQTTPALPAAPPLTSFGSRYVSGDFDGDGDEDLLVEHFSTQGQSTTLIGMRLLKHLGSGHYADGGPATPPGTGIVPPSVFHASMPEVLVRDCDGDGNPDLLIQAFLPTQGSHQPARLWLNDGTGFFTPVPLPTISNRIYEVHDLDGDGLPDLIGSSIYDNLGGGTFAPARPLLQSGTFYLNDMLIFGPLQIAVFDADQDGFPDILAIEQELLGSSVPGNQLWFLKNLGPAQPGRFAKHGLVPTTVWPSEGTSIIASGQTPRYVHAVDVTGNGRLDLVAGPVVHSNLKGSLLVLNTGSNPLAWTPGQILVMRPRGFIDIDGDGDRDGFGLASGQTGLWRNGLRSGEAAGLRLQFGAGTPGSGGIQPILGIQGPLHVGGSATLSLRAGLGGGEALLAFGTSPAQAPLLDGTLYIDDPAFLPVQLGGAPAAPGEGSWSISLSLADPSIAGIEIFAQAGIGDPGAFFGVALTGGLRVRIAP